MTSTKLFDPQLKATYGDAAEDVVLHYLRNTLGSDNVEQLPLGIYGPDLGFRHDGEWVYADVERRGNWKADQADFPFDTVHMPKRKLKFAALGRPYFYISVRDDCQRAIIFRHDDIQDAICVVCGNRFVAAGELFVDLPTGKGSYVALSQGE